MADPYEVEKNSCWGQWMYGGFVCNSLLFHLRAEMHQIRGFPNRNTAQPFHLFTLVRLPFGADNSSWLNLFSESTIPEITVSPNY